MRRLAVGMLAHVDAGKTTLSEGLLYTCGQLKKLGRVDHRDAFLDTHQLERERGITIFSKQAVLPLDDVTLTLLDTPGHVDFSAEMERVLQVLDYAILVVSGQSGIQAHTETLWRLLKEYAVPTFLFINKMDIAGTDGAALLAELVARFGDGCVDFTNQDDDWQEAVALTDEEAMERYLNGERLDDNLIGDLIQGRKVFPCYFGSALKLQGVDVLLRDVERFAQMPDYDGGFGGRVYKIARDEQGTRLTYLKVTGGSLKVKDVVAEGEKCDQIRIYSGAKFQAVAVAEVGTVCAVTGLTGTYPGQALGSATAGVKPALEPVLTYGVGLPDGVDAHVALGKLEQLQEEDPMLRVVWNPRLGEIQMQLMGDIQLEILGRVIAERFGMAVTFDAGRIVYRETIAKPVIGVGHYEPLRHYAEAHIKIEPLERGRGVELGCDCDDDVLDGGWQRLILTHLAQRAHLGVLTGSPITDVKLTLVTGRGHQKHTEGGDFRQATYRAVRQGLMQAESILLEPCYAFRLLVPTLNVGRAMSDLQRLFATFELGEAVDDMTLLTGEGPVSTLRDYSREVTAYTKGRGQFAVTPSGYAVCHNQEEVVVDLGYDPERDLENPADSVFCAHGAGFGVKWHQVGQYQHMESRLEPKEVSHAPAVNRSRRSYAAGLEADKELQAIFERTYGPVKRRDFMPQKSVHKTLPDKVVIKSMDDRPEYLLVDGYNMIFAWDDLKALAQSHLELARQRLMDWLCDYQGYKKCKIILVFDAYKVPQGMGSVNQYHNITVVFTKEAETADSYIEKATYALGRDNRVQVATSDGLEQLIILSHGALRVSARQFRLELDSAMNHIANLVNTHNQKTRGSTVGERLRQ